MRSSRSPSSRLVPLAPPRARPDAVDERGPHAPRWPAFSAAPASRRSSASSSPRRRLNRAQRRASCRGASRSTLRSSSRVAAGRHPLDRLGSRCAGSHRSWCAEHCRSPAPASTCSRRLPRVHGVAVTVLAAPALAQRLEAEDRAGHGHVQRLAPPDHRNRDRLVDRRPAAPAAARAPRCRARRPPGPCRSTCVVGRPRRRPVADTPVARRPELVEDRRPAPPAIDHRHVEQRRRPTPGRTSGWSGSTAPPQNTTAAAPAASALRSRVPALPGSATPARTTTNAGARRRLGEVGRRPGGDRRDALRAAPRR